MLVVVTILQFLMASAILGDVPSSIYHYFILTVILFRNFSEDKIMSHQTVIIDI